MKLKHGAFAGVALAVILSAVLCILSVSVPVHAASTGHSRPFTNTICSYAPGCNAETFWNTGNFTVHGISTIVETSTPSYSGSNSFRKYIEIDTADTLIQVVQESNSYCSSGGVTVHYIVEEFGGPTYDHCFPLNPNDYNQDILFKVSYYVSNGGGWFIWITGKNNQYCTNPPPCSYSTIPDSHSSDPFEAVSYNQQLDNTGFTGHAIWGSDWVNNQYFDGRGWLWDGQNHGQMDGSAYTSLQNANGTFSQQNLGSGTVSNDIPPQMYWKTPPNGTVNNGGVLYSCDYDSTTNSCILGS